MLDLAGDTGPEHGAARLALQRHDPVVKVTVKPLRIGEEPVGDPPGNLAADLLVAARKTLSTFRPG